MKRIGVFIQSAPNVGGVFQYTQSILDALCTLNSSLYEVVAIYTRDEFKEYFKKSSIELFKVEFNYHTMPKIIDGLKCDLLICPAQEELPGFLSTPVLGTIHDLMHRYERRFPEVSAEGEFASRERRLRTISEYSAGILVDSEIGKKHVTESYGSVLEEKLYVLPFTPSKYVYDEYDQQDKTLGKYIFYPAQFWLHKNHKNLILAVARLRNRGIKVKLVFAGSKKNGYDEVVKLIHELDLEDSVTILGFVTNQKLKALYQNARAMVMPTFFGPTNIPPLEGFLLGCPVAVSAIYAMPEQVKDAALTFDPNNVDEIAEVIEKMWFDDDLCYNLIRKGKERIQYFSVEKFSERLVAIIEKVLDREKNMKLHVIALIEFCSKYKKVFLYGAGQYAYWIGIYLKIKGINPAGFVVTRKKHGESSLLGLPVYEISEILSFKRKSCFILSTREHFQQEIEGYLQTLGFDTDQYFKVNNGCLNEINMYFASVRGMVEKELFLRGLERNE